MADDKTKRRWETFAREYCVDLNATRAAIAAGCSAKGAAVRGSEMLDEPEVVAMVDAILTERATRLEIKGQRILEVLRALATFDARNFYNDDGSLKEIKDLDWETQLGLAGFEVDHIPGGKGVVSKVKLARPGERAAAAAILAKYLPDMKENPQNVSFRFSQMGDAELEKRIEELLKKRTEET
jgi:hypothetical protein